MKEDKSISLVSIDSVTLKRLKRRDYYLRSTYKINLEIYKQMEDATNGACYICNKKTKLVVDHDHSDGKVRGLLCHNCNVMLGHAKDNINVLLKAVDYLKTCKEKSYEIKRVSTPVSL